MANTVILEGEVGSGAYGLSVGSSDTDLMRVELEPVGALLGLAAYPKTRVERPVGNGDRSRAGDTETAVYPLRKFVSMLVAGNPNVLPLLWTPNLTSEDVCGIREMRGSLVTRRVVTAMSRVAAKWVGELNGDYKPSVSRPELEAEFGFDVKKATHALRVLVQARSLIRDQEMMMPLRGEELGLALATRRGEVGFQQTLNTLRNRLAEVDSANIEHLPGDADTTLWSDWLVGMYRAAL